MRFNRGQLGSSAALAVSAGIPTLGSLTGDLSTTLAIGSLTTATAFVGNLLLVDATDPWVERQRVRHFLLSACQPAIEELRRKDKTARLNVMLVRRSPFWWRSGFEFHTQLHMDPSPDRSIQLRSKHGVAGWAHRTRKWAVGDFLADKLYQGPPRSTEATDQIANPQYSLTTEQRQATSHLKLIYSYPFFQIVKGEGEQQVKTNRVLGVVNVDSSRQDAWTFYQNEGLHHELLSDTLPAIATVAELLFS